MNKRTTKATKSATKVKGSRTLKKNTPRTARKTSPRTSATKRPQEAIHDVWWKNWPKLVARAWADEAFMTRLINHPEEVAKDYKLPLIEGTRYKVVSGNEQPTLVLSLPPKPANLKLESMEELAEYAEQKHCHHSSCL